ncbi:class I SAM-dependent methyltransferase [Amycolatopsis sp., V23-08]|uniref:Class I SAM-dependent methyltransferase n=1 Tax=Amycolatopsis heterodermiae TaxID=3110235 RepID=A0ABU5R2W6_9PSEU|nr:class I SAM-dependent methyltransferase [Amycolatopsis sp., V23-08]MEA5360557.1 class I SAM-dependent methyltransferase [Amycolatopsis sp., V23-08]
MHDEATRFWDEHYRNPPAERVNPLLAEVAGPLPAGTALDLGCGSGGDALWLARRGWRVTAADLASPAIESLRQRTGGLPVTPVRIDLAEAFPDGTFDLVSAQYLHTPFPLARERVLRRATDALRPGGLLLVVDHGSAAPWSWNQDADFPRPTFDLDPARFSVERADSPQRVATGPDGRTATVTDHVLLVRREPNR